MLRWLRDRVGGVFGAAWRCVSDFLGGPQIELSRFNDVLDVERKAINERRKVINAEHIPPGAEDGASKKGGARRRRSARRRRFWWDGTSRAVGSVKNSKATRSSKQSTRRSAKKDGRSCS